MPEQQNIENKQSWRADYFNEWVGGVAFSKDELFTKTINS